MLPILFLMHTLKTGCHCFPPLNTPCSVRTGHWASLLTGGQDHCSPQTSCPKATEPTHHSAGPKLPLPTCAGHHVPPKILLRAPEQRVLCSEVLHSLTSCSYSSVHPPHLDGLGYVHFVDLNLGKAAPRHIFILLVIAIKQVSGIYSHTNCSLRDDKWNRHLALANIRRTHRTSGSTIPAYDYILLQFSIVLQFCNYFYHYKMHFLMRKTKVNDCKISKQSYKSSNRLEKRQFFSTNSTCKPRRSFFYCDTLQKQLEHLYTTGFLFPHNCLSSDSI